MISVLVPTFGRPGRLADVTANILEATRSECEVVIIAEADDPESIAAAEAIAGAVLVVNSRAHSWSGAINDGFAHIRGDFYFTGSDDLRFHDGWDEPALAVLAAGPHLRVCGTNDLCSSGVRAGTSSTSHLVDRRYIDDPGGVIDQPPGTCQYEGYDSTTPIRSSSRQRNTVVFSPRAWTASWSTCITRWGSHQWTRHTNCPPGTSMMTGHCLSRGATCGSGREVPVVR